MADIELADRTLDQWEELSDEALRLACLEAHLLSSGPRYALISSLHTFYQSQPPVIVANNTDSATNVVAISTSSTPAMHGPPVVSHIIQAAPTLRSTNISCVVPVVNPAQSPFIDVNNVPMVQNQAAVSIDISTIVAREVRRQLQQPEVPPQLASSNGNILNSSPNCPLLSLVLLPEERSSLPAGS